MFSSKLEIVQIFVQKLDWLVDFSAELEKILNFGFRKRNELYINLKEEIACVGNQKKIVLG